MVIADTVTAGYPAHRVIAYCQWFTERQAPMTTWFSACSINHTQAGHVGVLGRAGDARRTERCQDCFPHGVGGSFPAPTKFTHEELLAFLAEGQPDNATEKE